MIPSASLPTKPSELPQSFFFEEGQALPNPSDAKQTAEYVGETRVVGGPKVGWVTWMFRIQCNLNHEKLVIKTMESEKLDGLEEVWIFVAFLIKPAHF